VTDVDVAHIYKSVVQLTEYRMQKVVPECVMPKLEFFSTSVNRKLVSYLTVGNNTSNTQ
jgi:hypothetical protein